MDKPDVRRANCEKLGIDLNLVIRLYQEQKTCLEIGKIIGYSNETVRRVLKNSGTPLRVRGAGGIPPQKNPFYRGGVHIHKNRYRKILRPDGHHGYVWEHRHVAEQKLGRHLLKSEVVHHVNGNGLDNRPENLEVFDSNADHLRHELTGRVPKWTEDGKRRIQAGIARSLANRAAANRLRLKTDDPQ